MGTEDASETSQAVHIPLPGVWTIAQLAIQDTFHRKFLFAK